ncbi:MAG: hypothetical protein KA368_23525, partial [Acidobacteria bacterium]|nr:hypothetical protein [Acidobacteriota bacterium]
NTASRAVAAVEKKSGPAAMESEASTRQDQVMSPNAMSRCQSPDSDEYPGNQHCVLRAPGLKLR